MDYLKQPLAALPKIHRFLETHQYVTAIGTCRRADNGGKFKGSLASQLEVLTKAHAAGCQIVDLEFQSALKSKPEAIARLRSRAGLILSFHDFRATRNLDETLEKMLKIPADFYKVVTHRHHALRQRDHDEVSADAERQACADRVVHGRTRDHQPRAQRARRQRFHLWRGQRRSLKPHPARSARADLRSIYRIDQVDAATRVYGVAGDPIEHSLSPVIMNTALRRENVNGVYLPLHAKTLKDLMRCVREIPLHGLSVTMPYKQSILAHLDNTDAHTTKIGACNTVVRGQDGKLYGFNTDVAGVVRPLEQRLSIENAKVLVLGAGGAARAAVFGLKERGAEIWILNRTSVKGQKLARQAKARTIKRADLRKIAFDVIINATPVGMGNTRDCPLKDEEIQARVVFDMVYDPVETHLLQVARAKGIAVIPGVEMFVQQAARQFEIWTGKPAPAGDMLRAVTIALQERAAAQKPKS